MAGTPRSWQRPQDDSRTLEGWWGPQGDSGTPRSWQDSGEMAGTPKSRWDPRKLLGTPRSQWEPHEASRDPGELSGTPGSRRDPGKPRAPPAPGATACLPQHHRGGAGLHRQPHPLRRHLHRRRLGVPAPCRPPARCRPALHLLPPLHEHRRWGGLPPSLAWGRGTWRLGFAMDRGWDEGGSVGQGPPREGQPRSPPTPAEQMGRILQRTAISTNIKERLDFSCALFGPDGGLVSNAPHIPVHLGAMQETVQFQVGESPGTSPAPGPPPTRGPAQPFPVPLQIRNLGEDLREGDVILSNHPCAGGSHLPDLTVITPVSEGQGRGTPTPGHPWGAGPPTKTPAQHQALPRSSGRASPSPSSSWPAAGTTRTSGASPPAPCPPTLRLCVRRGPSSSPSSW